MLPPERPNLSPVDAAVQRLELCTHVIQELHVELEEPSDPELKADLLLASENLAYEVIDLLNTAKLYAWGKEEPEDED